MAEGTPRPTPAACSRAFTLWLWAIPFWFDFRVNGFDVLPDIMGYALIALGAAQLWGFHKRMVSIQRLALLLAATSVLDEFEPGGGTGPLPAVGVAVLLVSIALAAGSTLLAWWMCEVVADFARRLHAWDTARAAELRRYVYLGWQVGLVAALGLYASTQGGDGLLVLAASFAGIAVLGLLMELMLQARQLCRGPSDTALPTPEPKPAPETSPTPAPT